MTRYSAHPFSGNRCLWWLTSALALVAIAAPWLSPYPPDRQLDILALRSLGPSTAHPFGTDQFSRDVLSRVLHGARVSLGFAGSAVLLSLMVGTAYGAMTVFTPRRLSALLRRFIDVALSVPRLLVLLTVTAFIGALPIPALVLLVALTGWFATARLVTDELDGLLQREFTLAARSVGVPTPSLFTRHLFPHLIPVLAVTGAFAMANTIALEAGLSFLGLGIQPPTASWGTILHDSSASFGTEWWIAVFPGLATVGAILLCHALGDALREHFAPAHVPDYVSATPGLRDAA